MLLSVRDAAELLHTTERQIYRWVDDEEIPFQRVRDQVRFNRTELLEWATGRRLPVALQAFDSDDPDEAAPSLARALQIGGTHAIQAADREQAIEAAVAKTPLPPTVDRELLTEVLRVRETTSSTAIGEGIAIPHVRHPVIGPGAVASVSVCFLEAAVPFGAPDDQPVHTLFIIISPTVRAHLQLLARVARALTDPGFRAALAQRRGIAELAREAARVESTSLSTSGGGTSE